MAMIVRVTDLCGREPPYKPVTLRPVLEWLNITCGGRAVEMLWGERDETLLRIIKIMTKAEERVA